MDSNITQSLRIPVIQTEQYRVLLQALAINEVFYTFVHCDILEPSVSAIKNLKMDWNTFVDLHNGPLLAFNEMHDEKHRHFLDFFGFEYLQDLTGTDGTTRKLYILK